MDHRSPPVQVKLVTWVLAIVLVPTLGQRSGQVSFLVRERLPEGVYTGQSRNGVPHGRGTIQYRDSDQSGRFNYTGDFSIGSLSGSGTMIWRNGASYTGTIRNNLMEGEGVYSWPNGDRYVGEYANGRRNGIGEMEYADGDAYRGSWRDGKYHGQGRYEWANGNDYQGDWENGVAMGHGEFEYGSGSRQRERYSGAFNSGVKHGYGTYYYPNGQSFVGEYRNGLRNGPGTLYFDAQGTRKRDGFWIDGILQDDEGNNSALNGQALSTDTSTFISSASFTNDRRRPDSTTTETNSESSSFLTVSNFGSVAEVDDDVNFVQNRPNAIDASDQVTSTSNSEPSSSTRQTTLDTVRTRFNYTGSWLDGSKNGRGTMVWRSGDRYTGNWLNDLPHGQGEYIWAAGHQYNGDYRQGQPDGFGLFQSERGDIFQGQFRNGLPHGQGEYFYGGGDKRLDKYVGEFDRGAFHGDGKYFFANGDRYEGNFANGERSGQGIMFYNTGGYRQGTWRNDRLVGRVTYNKPDGTFVTEVWQEPRDEMLHPDLDDPNPALGQTSRIEGMEARTQAKQLFKVLVSAGTFDSLLGSEETASDAQIRARDVQNDSEGSLRAIRQLF